MTKEEFKNLRLKKRAKIAHQKKIIETNKQYLADTDYQAIKYFEGVMSESEFAPIKVLRAEARAKINVAEVELDKLKGELDLLLKTEVEPE